MRLISVPRTLGFSHRHCFFFMLRQGPSMFSTFDPQDSKDHLIHDNGNTDPFPLGRSNVIVKVIYIYTELCMYFMPFVSVRVTFPSFTLPRARFSD